MTQLTKVKQNIHEHKDKSCNPKNILIHGPTGRCELFLLTVPTEEVARCQYKTVQITFALNFRCCQMEGRGHTLNVIGRFTADSYKV